MPSLKIDGEEIPFQDGDSVLRAAWRAGREIPHYCWHPGLSVAANCRMCLVEVKGGRKVEMPILRFDDATQTYVEAKKTKLQPACQLDAAEGLEIETDNEEVRAAQAAVQEFLLLNHPVDCPICDQAGECKLQDYWLAHQRSGKRKESEPVHKPKGVRFGPTIVYDAERCIMCTRCIRVCDELAKDHVLDMRERGNKNEIVLAPGRELDHRYTLMTEHVCPVGALTSRDFRFKARVWFLKTAKGVCSGCATGCTSYVDYDPRNGTVYRLRPRDNPEVNQYWMCDDGMMTYKEVHEDRVLVAQAGRRDEREDVAAPAALELAAQALSRHDGKRVAVVLSALSSSEDNFALASFAKLVLKTDAVFLAARPAWEGDDILRNADHNPNRAGATSAAKAAAVGGALGSLEDLSKGISNGEFDAAILLGAAGDYRGEVKEKLLTLETCVCLTANEGPAADVSNVVLPIASWAETDGMYTNAEGIAQRFESAIPARGSVRPAWQLLRDLADRLGTPLGVKALADLRTQMSGTSAASAATQPEARA